jgi:hypothetical protein
VYNKSQSDTKIGALSFSVMGIRDNQLKFGFSRLALILESIGNWGFFWRRNGLILDRYASFCYRDINLINLWYTPYYKKTQVRLVLFHLGCFILVGNKFLFIHELVIFYSLECKHISSLSHRTSKKPELLFEVVNPIY